MTETNYRERLEAVAQMFTDDDANYTYTESLGYHKVEFYLVRSEITYLVDLVTMENFLDQKISASVYRRDPWTCLARISWVDDAMLVNMLSQIVGLKVFRYPGNFDGLDPETLLIDSDGEPVYAKELYDNDGVFPIYHRHYLPAVLIATGDQVRASRKDLL